MKVEELSVNCPLCQHPGKKIYQFSFEFKNYQKNFIYFLCSKCPHLWLTPFPSQKEINQIYANYHTHQLKTKKTLLASFREKCLKAFLSEFYGYGYLGRPKFLWRLLGLFIRKIPFFYQRAILAINGVEGREKGKLLDVGCGHGAFLYQLGKLGWEVSGVEPDEVAAQIARKQFGLNIFCGPLEEAQLPASTFEAIVFRHSLEHIPFPLKVMEECWRILKPGGKVHIFTPNVESLGHSLFKFKWRGLEPPRHLHIYSLNSIISLLKKVGFTIEEAWTTSRYASFYFLESQKKKKSLLSKTIAFIFQLLETCLLILKPKKGEEIFIKAKKE